MDPPSEQGGLLDHIASSSCVWKEVYIGMLFGEAVDGQGRGFHVGNDRHHKWDLRTSYLFAGHQASRNLPSNGLDFHIAAISRLPTRFLLLASGARLISRRTLYSMQTMTRYLIR